ncbi:rifin [Plasmodium reichenowi]|uniref:Rifin n=1 Tax=Plasmodium reichenowi TaxID=5854 RepID=A0A151L277_PLARE|nr:rifin [Plasmodium reichenowi]KYN93050.1 rifin [Plasmodium reichenowi]
MKVHCYNILLFSLLLNTLLLSSSQVYNQRNHYNTPHIKNREPTNLYRSLCECELYAPANYDNDTEMKKVMENFNKQTQQRLHEYDERMKTTRQKCKDQCNKEIKKIILKDKIDKELTEKFATLQTDIQNDAIPTCICEKSIADKMEKGCLRCAGVLGGGVMPGMGLIDGSLLGAISVLQPAAIEAAKAAAVTEATKAATNAGIEAVKLIINEFLTHFKKEFYVDLTKIVKKSTYNNFDSLFQSAKELLGDSCRPNPLNGSTNSFCNSTICEGGERTLRSWVQAGATKYEAEFALQKEALEATKVGAVEATTTSCQTAIIASIVAIVIIVLIMVIIYLILRYRRKKKMKKKFQYIKLLED